MVLFYLLLNKWHRVGLLIYFLSVCVITVGVTMRLSAVFLVSLPVFVFSAILLNQHLNLVKREMKPIQWNNNSGPQLAFYVNLHRAVIGLSATLTGRWRPDIDLRRMLTGSSLSCFFLGTNSRKGACVRRNPQNYQDFGQPFHGDSW